MPGQMPISRPVLVACLLLALVTMTVMLKVEVPLLLGMHPDWDRKVYAYRWLLHLHAGLGCLALFAAPAQFIPQLRRRYLHAHRLLGRVYVGAIAVSAPIGLYIATAHLLGNERVAAAVQAVAWLGTTLIALYAAISKQLAAHKRWMIRSYALTFSFVVSRFVVDVLAIKIAAGFGGNGALTWACTCIALSIGPLWWHAGNAVLPRALAGAPRVAE